MSDLGLEVCWQVDDVDSTKRAFFRADTTTDAQTFGYVGNFGLGRNFDTQLAGSDNRARLFAFLSTFL
jgi:hypothetical protein